MIYKIDLESIGEITLLPDSQKLFGFLMSKLSNHFGTKEVDAFVSAVGENRTKCRVSNLLPEGYMPFPRSYILDHMPSHSKELYVLLKKIDYIDEQSLIYIINYIKPQHRIEPDGKPFKSLEELEEAIGSLISFASAKQRYLQKFKLEGQEKAIPGLPNKAYSLPILEYYDRDEKMCSGFSFYVEADEDSLLSVHLEQLLGDYTETKAAEEVYGLGAKASHGYNTYILRKVEKYKEETKENRCLYLNIGMLLPRIEEINGENSHLEIYSSNRKSYEISDSVEKVISFVAPGSIIDPKNKGDNLGRCITNPYNAMHKNAIIFGNSFVKKIEVTK